MMLGGEAMGQLRGASQARLAVCVMYPRLCGNPEKPLSPVLKAILLLIHDPPWLPGQRIAPRCFPWCSGCARCGASTPSQQPEPPWLIQPASSMHATSWPILAWCHRNILGPTPSHGADPRAGCAITKAGPRALNSGASDVRAHTLLIEAAWSYRYPARIVRQVAGD